MDRITAIVLFFVSLVVFYLIAYYGAIISWWSSFVLSVFLSLILLNVVYPPSMIAMDSADAGLVLYAVIEILSLVILAIYILQRAVIDRRDDVCLL